MKILALPPPEAMYRALVRRDAAYEGVFVAAVRTTSVFCRPTCTARKPRRANVEFFADAASAEAEGYRACRVCRPREPAGAVPEWLRPVLDARGRIRDADLRALGISPARVRRWFRAHHGMTFHAFRRGARLRNAVEALRRGDRVVDAAFGAGYEALSGFTESFKKTVGVAPSEGRARRVVALRRLTTPLGPMWAGATEAGICLLEFAGRPVDGLPGASAFFGPIEAQLAEYFAGRRRRFDVPLAPGGTPFQLRVWTRLLAIPYGETRAYGELGPARAVARACAANPIGIVIPCHRVIGADGRLTGYGGELWRKQRLLDLERY